METRRGRRPFGWLGLLGLLLAAGCDLGPLPPLAGLAPWREPAAFAVRDGQVDLAGGNLLLRRTDLTIETRLGTQAVTHTYNSATDRWTWSFEMTYAGGVFTDDGGARYALGAAAPGPIAGTRWRKVDGATIESRGGLRFSFAPDGRLARVAWRHASQPSLVLSRPGDGSLHIAQCTAPAACADVFVVSYAGADVVAIDDRAGRHVAYGYAGGRLQWVETPFERENGLPPRRYDHALGASGRTTALVVESPERERARYELDGAGRVTGYELVGEERPRWSFEHLAGPRRTLVDDPLGRRTELRFDGTRRLVELSRPALGESTTLGWTGLRVTRVTGPDGLVTTTRYGADDEPEQWTLPGGRTIELEYVPGAVNLGDPFAALPSRVRDAGEVVVARTFDAQGRLASETNGAGERMAFSYGPLETLAQVDLATGLSVRLAGYGDDGRPREVRVPAAQAGEPEWVEHREFDAVGDMTRGSEPGSASGSQYPGVVARRFDAARHLRALEMSMTADHGTPQDVVLAYRSDGQLRAIQRPYGAAAELEYDAIGRLRTQRERVDGAWAETRFAWTPLGELARAERPNGMAQELAYDAAGHVARLTNRRGGALESELLYGYQAGRLVRKDDSTAPGPTRIGYDAAGRVRSVAWPEGEQSWLSYDARDRLAGSTLLRADGSLLRQLGIRYDAAGREARLLDGAAVVYEQVFASGRLAAIRHGNGVVRTLSYDGFGRPAGAVSRDAAGRELEAETVLRQGRDFAGPDPNGFFRETLTTYQAGTGFGPVAFEERAVGFRYADGRRWIPMAADSGTVEWCNGPSCGALGDSSWHVLSGLTDLEQEFLPRRGGEAYQERLFRRNPERNRLHDVVLRTVTPAPKPCSPCEDAQVDVVEHHYTWDAAGFATSRDGVPLAWDATGHLTAFGPARFERDAEGRLRGSRVAGVESRRRFGGLVEADANGNAVRIDLGAVAIDLAANRRTYRHFDWRGNVRSVWDDAGQIRAVREYGAWGPDRRYGEAGDPRGFAQGLEAAGLVVLGDRVYDPDARQFLSPDPVYSALHQYVYGAGDPANYWDWTGRAAADTVGFRVAGAFGQFVGAASVVVPAIVLAVTGRVGPAMALNALAPAAGEAGRAWFQLWYTLAYDLLTKEPDPAAPAAPAPSPAGTHWPFPGGVPPALGGAPLHPEPSCAGGECHLQWGSAPRLQPPPAPGSGSLRLDFALSPSSACGLLGAEPLVLIAFLLRRRRAPEQR